MSEQAPGAWRAAFPVARRCLAVYAALGTLALSGWLYHIVRTAGVMRAARASVRSYRAREAGDRRARDRALGLAPTARAPGVRARSVVGGLLTPRQFRLVSFVDAEAAGMAPAMYWNILQREFGPRVQVIVITQQTVEEAALDAQYVDLQLELAVDEDGRTAAAFNATDGDRVFVIAPDGTLLYKEGWDRRLPLQERVAMTARVLRHLLASREAVPRREDDGAP